MIRRDITDEWPLLRGDPLMLQRYVLDLYGAERTELAPFPRAALYSRGGTLLGFVNTYGYPRITTEGDRVYLELSDLVVSLATAQAEMREPLAALAHEQWSGWMRWMFSKGTFNDDGTWTMPAAFVQRWQRQMNASYAELSDVEKASDRTEAEKVLALFEEEYAHAVQPGHPEDVPTQAGV